MNRPDLKAVKHPAGKDLFRTGFTFAALFTLVLTFALLATGCKKDTDKAKRKNEEIWEKIMENDGKRPDLVLAFYAQIHEELYKKAAEEFGKSHNCTVKLLCVKSERLTDHSLPDAMEAGSDVPDLVELLDGTMGNFTNGPIENVGFVDLTDRLREEGYLDPDKMVQRSYSPWSSRGHIFAIPKTVHPVALCYRVDLIEKLGIDVTKLKTWDDFVRVGQEITGEWDYSDYELGIRRGDKRFMIDFFDDSLISLNILLNQRGLDYFDADGNVAFDTPEVAELIAWFVHQTGGPKRIAVPAGDGLSFYLSMEKGRELFFFTPDWRTMQYTLDLNFDPRTPEDMKKEPSILKGKLALMPMPVWADENGNRLPGSYGTGTWGGVGLAITKHCKNQELAWEFAKYLYLEADDEDFAYRFRKTNIVPAVKRAWSIPGFNDESLYFRQMVHDNDDDDPVVRPVFNSKSYDWTAAEAADAVAEFDDGDESDKPVVRPISIGRFYASIADDTPPRHVTAYSDKAMRQVYDVYSAARDFYESKIEEAGDDPDPETLRSIDNEMLSLIRTQLAEKAALIRKKMK